MQSTTFKHVKRKPKKEKVSGGEPILVRHIIDPISGVSLGTNRLKGNSRQGT
jgi:hypothetical protein